MIQFIALCADFTIKGAMGHRHMMLVTAHTSLLLSEPKGTLRCQNKTSSSKLGSQRLDAARAMQKKILE